MSPGENEGEIILEKKIDNLLVQVGVGEELHISGLESQNEEWRMTWERSELQPSDEPLANGVGWTSSGEHLVATQVGQ